MHQNPNSPYYNNVSLNTFQKFLAGFSSSPFFMYFAIIVPWSMNTIFQAGLHSWTLYIAASTIPLVFISLFLVMLMPAARDILQIIASVCASIFSAITGLIANFGDNSGSIPDVIVFAMFLLSGFIAVYLDVLGKNHMMLQARSSTRLPRLYLQGFGFALPVIVMGLAREIFQLDGWLFYVASAVFILAPLAKLLGKERVTQDVEGASPASPNPAIKTSLAVLAIMLFFTTFMFSLIINTEAASHAVVGYLGIAAGVVVAFIAGKKAWLARSAVLPGILVLYVIFVLDPILAAHGTFILFVGFFPGLVIGEIGLHASLLPRSPRKSSEGLYLFAIWFIAIVAAVLAQYVPALVNDLNRMNASGLVGMLIPLFFFVALAVAALSIATSQGAKRLFQVAIKGLSQPVSAVPLRRKNVIAAVVLATVVLGPLIATGLYLNSNSTVKVMFSRTMYDVNGNNMTEVDLAPMTAKILFYSPNPTNGTPHGELIRPGMSVRLGGYYYGFSEPNATFTKNDVINWVAANNDVFSFGFCGLTSDTMMPSDIMTIKTMNPAARFYYMAFATTLFENPTSNNTGPTWTGTHYPTVGFNDTIRSLTLKLANGSEALGVRRDSVSSNAHLMDLGNPGLAKYFAYIYENRCEQFHANGVAIDEVMWNNYWDVSDWNHGEPLLNYTSTAQVHQTCYDWLQRIRNDMSVDIITQAFWPEAQQFQNGVWGETSFSSIGGQYGSTTNDINKTVWYESNNWQGVVQTAYDIGSKNESYIWAAWYQRGNAASLEYAISTYMMAKPNGITSLVFHPQPVYNGGYPANLAGYAVETVKEEVQHWPQYFNIQLGDALGTMQLKSGFGGQYYERDFQNGIVIVNPFHAHIIGF